MNLLTLTFKNTRQILVEIFEIINMIELPKNVIVFVFIIVVRKEIVYCSIVSVGIELLNERRHG